MFVMTSIVLDCMTCIAYCNITKLCYC